MMHVRLGLGSNINPQRNLPLGLAALTELFGELTTSDVYEGAALGFVGDPFWNLVVELNTELTLKDLQADLRRIEYAHGRLRDAPRLCDRALDIDILTYGNLVGTIDGITLPRAEIVDAAFVLRPLAELSPDGIHPSLGRSFAELWREFDQQSQPLTRVSLRG